MPPTSKSGPCRIVYNSGDVYTGNRKNGKKDGAGTYRWVNGSSYDGQWKNDLKHGVGTWRAASGDTYRGAWVSNKMHGHGVWRSVTGGDCYDGMWANSKREGTGKSTTADGDVYEGEWKASFRHGRGTCRFKLSGGSYDGDWARSQREGIGTFYEAGGMATLGRWERDKFVEGVKWSADRQEAWCYVGGKAEAKFELLADASSRASEILGGAGATHSIPPQLPLSLRPFAASAVGWSSADGHTAFELRTCLDGKEYTSHRRFSEFVELHAKLAITLPGALPANNLGSRVAQLVPDLALLRQARLAMLNEYLAATVAAADAQLAYPFELLSFLGVVPKEAPPTVATPPTAALRLVQAISRGHPERVRFLLYAKADANAMATRGGAKLSMLHVALSMQSGVVITRLLLNADADVNARDAVGMTALHIASRSFCSAEAELLLEATADLNAINVLGKAPLDYALVVHQTRTAVVEGERARLVQTLTARGAAASRPPPGSLAPGLELVTQAAFTGDAVRVAELLAARTDVNFLVGPYSALYVAGPMGHVDVVRALLAATADANATVNGTPLVISAISGCGLGREGKSVDDEELSVTRLLIGAKANLDAMNPDEGRTALMRAVACKDPQPALIRVLIDGGASINARGLHGQTALIFAARNSPGNIGPLLQAGADVNLRGGSPIATTAINIALSHGILKTAAALLRKGADPNIASEPTGANALMVACDFGRAAMVAPLLAARSDPLARAAGPSCFTALMFAARKGHVDCVNALVSVEQATRAVMLNMLSGVEGGDGGGSRVTALHIAAWYKKTACVLALVGAGADVNIRGTAMSTPLTVAADTGDAPLVKALIDAKADTNAKRTPDGSTALGIAAAAPHTEVVAVLIEGSCDINLANRAALTPLMQAAQKAHLEAVRLLLDAHAAIDLRTDPTGVTPHGWTALDVARGAQVCGQANRRDAVVALLEAATLAASVSSSHADNVVVASRRGGGAASSTDSGGGVDRPTCPSSATTNGEGLESDSAISDQGAGAGPPSAASLSTGRDYELSDARAAKAAHAHEEDGFAVVPLQPQAPSDARTWRALQSLLETDTRWLGKGRDAQKKLGPYDSLALARAWRIEHPMGYKKVLLCLLRVYTPCNPPRGPCTR